MAHEAGVKPLINDLITHGHEFSFVQVMRLARKHLDSGGKDGLPIVPWQDRVEVRPELSLAFPAADVARVEQHGDHLRVTATFLELYGPASPLPNFFTEELFDEASHDESVLRDFIDILHQRSYQLYFRCWSKYRLLIRVVEEQNPIDRERLLCLIGLGEKELASSVPEAYALLRYTGILTQYPRSAAGLATMLRDALKLKSIRIIQNVKRMVSIPGDQLMRMGMTGCRLGMDTVLGSRIADRMGRFRIEIGPLAWDVFNSFLPGTVNHEKLSRYTRFYLVDPLDVELKLILAAGEAKPIRIGDPNAKLGINTWSFAGDTLGEVSAGFQLSSQPFASPAPLPETGPRHTGRGFIDYYRAERARLGELAVRFTDTHPNLAPMLSGPMSDPGVERLLEGTAFLNALLQQRLDDDFPEFIHEVTRALHPELLRPVPATTIVAFTPKRNLTGTQTIPAGTELKSVPVDGTQCRFTSCWPVEIHPLTLTGASFAQPPGKPAAITLGLKLAGITLSNWKVHKLRLFLAGEYINASNLYLVLMRSVKRIVISPRHGSGKPTTLEPSHLKPVGLEDTDLLVPGSSTASRHQLLRECFIQPHKVLFLDLTGFDSWRDRGDGTDFEIGFELKELPFALHKVSADDFKLFATPAVNVFRYQARPITINDRMAYHPIKPEGSNTEHYCVYSVEKVCGLFRGRANPIVYHPEKQYNGNTNDNPSYKLTMRESSFHSGIDFSISVIDTVKTRSPETMILDIALMCTNGSLPNALAVGEICMPTTNSPAYATYSNVKNVVPSANPALGNNHLWKLFSILGLNLILLNVETLRGLLETFLVSDCPDYQEVLRQKNRLDGIAALDIAAGDRLQGSSILRGWIIRIKLQRKCFASDGDMYLFGAILDRFMALFVTQAFFTQTVVEDVQGRREYRWPVRMGRRQLV